MVETDRPRPLCILLYDWCGRWTSESHSYNPSTIHPLISYFQVFRPANVIFAGAGVLLSVVIVLDLPYSDHSDAKPIQTAKDVLGSLDAIMEILECIENFFRRLEVYANSEVPTTKAIKYVITKIMVAVLGIFAILTKEIKQGKPSQSIIDRTSSVADRYTVRFLKNFLKRLIGRADIEGSLKKLDRLTNEEFKMAVAQTLKEVLHIQRGVEGANKKLDELHRKFDEGRAGTFSYSQMLS